MEDNRKMTTSMQELVRKLVDKSIAFVFCPTYTRYENGMLYVGWIFNDDGTVKTYD